jgi:hypothetical protein
MAALLKTTVIKKRKEDGFQTAVQAERLIVN